MDSGPELASGSLASEKMLRGYQGLTVFRISSSSKLNEECTGSVLDSYRVDRKDSETMKKEIKERRESNLLFLFFLFWQMFRIETQVPLCLKKQKAKKGSEKGNEALFRALSRRISIGSRRDWHC